MSRKNNTTNGSNNGKKAVKKTLNNNSNSKKSNSASKRGNAMSNSARQVGSANSYATQQIGKAPIMTSTAKKCRVIHRELIRNLNGLATAAFNVNEVIAMNPGLSSFLPWLSRIARNWETYKFNKLRFCYYTRTGTTTVGSVILAPDYDASDPPPESEAQVSSYMDVREDAPWKDIVVNLNKEAMFSVGPKKFVRTGSLSVEKDLKLYDVGNMFLCTVDSVAAAAWGKIWVEYDVEFETPQLNADVSDGSEKQVSVAGNTGAKPFGTSALIVTDSGEPIAQWSDAGAGTFTLLRDYEGIFKMNFVGTVITAVALAGGTSTTTNLSRLFDGAGGLTAEYTTIFKGSKGMTFLGPVITAATITSAILRIGGYDTSSLA